MAAKGTRKRTGSEWVKLIINDPSQSKSCDWKTLKGSDWATLLSELPEFEDKCKKKFGEKNKQNGWSKLTESDWALLLATQPKFARRCKVWNGFKGSDWATLLSKQKQFAKNCDETVGKSGKKKGVGWTKLKGADWVALLLAEKGAEEFEDKCNEKEAWKKLSGMDWAKLLAKKPRLADGRDKLIKWDEMDGWCWTHLLESEPQFADHCKKWNEMNGSCWATLLARQPVFEGKCDEWNKWSMLDDWGWNHLLGSVEDGQQKRRFENKRKGVVDRISVTGEDAICSKAGERTEIVLNRMFNGGYLDDNIGHEIINMFKDDHGANYVYILPWGGYASCHYGKIGWVVLTRLVPKREALEVLALATGLQDVYDPNKGHGPDQWKNQKRFLEKNKVTYGNAKLVDILGDGSETAGLKQAVWISMRAKSVLKPNRPVFIVFGQKDTIEDKDAPNHHSICLKKNMASQSQKQYFNPDDADDTDYDKLKKSLIDNESLWENAESTSKIGTVDPSKITEDNFFDICGIADRELAFSDALAYFFRKYPSLATGFLDKLGIKLSEDFDCWREWENIDLLLEDEHQIVVIENKILSSINGVKMTDEEELSGSQLDKYCEIAEKRAKGEYLDDEDSLKLFLARHKKKVSGLILTPNYNHISLDDYNVPEKEFVCKNHYQHVTYGKLYEYFWDYMAQKVPNDKYFLEFLKGMEPHTDEHHNDLFKRMKNQFLKRIGDVKKHANY